MDFQRLKEFIVVAEHHNLSQAAKELLMSQPTLSQHIAALEKEVGFPLFERDRSGVKLTDEGSLFFIGAQDILNLYESTLMECRNIRKNMVNIKVLDLALVFDFGRYFDAATARASKAHPSRRYDITIVNSQHQPTATLVKKGEVDIGIAFDAPGGTETAERLRSEGLEAFRLCSVPYNFHIGNRSKYANMETIRPEDLSDVTLTVINQPSLLSFREALKKTLSSYGIEPRFRLMSMESPVDRMMVDDSFCSFVTPHHHAVLESLWGNLDHLVTVRSVEGLDISLDVLVVHARRPAGPVAEIIDELRSIVSDET